MTKNNKINPIVLAHWLRKFEKAIDILLKSGYSVEDIKNLIQVQYEKSSKTDGCET